MKSIKLARSRDEALIAEHESAADHRRQLSAAILWILAAWLIGVLVSEVSVLGAEPSVTQSIGDQWQQQETEFALLHSGMHTLERVHRTAQQNESTPAAKAQVPSKSLAAMIVERSNREEIDVAREAIGAPMVADHSVEPIATSTADRGASLAWQEIAKGLPAPIGLVAHGSRSLMTPVHVHPVVEPSKSKLQNSLSTAVAFVETDTQITELVESSVQDLASDASIVRARPQVRSVAEETVMVADTASSNTLQMTAATDSDAVDHSIVATDTATKQPNRSEPSLNRADAPLPPARPATNPSVATTEPTGDVPAPATKSVNPSAAERVAASWPFEKVKVESTGTGVKLNVDNADVRTVFEMLARGYRMNILVAPDVQGTVTANVDGLTPEQTLRGIVKMAGLSMQHDDNLIFIYAADNLPLDARHLRVFPLDFARATSIESTVQGLLSPVGNAYTSTINDQDTMQTRESIVVIDIPEVIAQVEDFVYQADQAPRQVLIEAHVLEVQLTDEMVHGVDLNALVSSDVTVASFGFAEPVLTASNPRYFASISGTDITGVLDLLQTTTDSKTLASPRVQVINGQNARIQVGQQLGFTVATVTQTSTIQDVQFLETGVVLNVTPTISRDNRVLLQVKPEVSDGEINPATLLPEEQTREVETSVLLNDHQGVIIGGLIQERDRTVIKKLPWLGDVQYVGKLFQRREAVRSRSEIIVALIPHVIESSCPTDERSMIDYDRVNTRLFHGNLNRTCRPWEPRMPDRAGEEQHNPDLINRVLP